MERLNQMCTIQARVKYLNIDNGSCSIQFCPEVTSAPSVYKQKSFLFSQQ